MAEIISLADYKEQSAVRSVARYWRTLFKEPFTAQIRLTDLRPKTLCYLAEPGDESTTVLYALVLGFIGFDETTTFESLDSMTQSHILDIQLFLSDQIRFEMMFRLGWLKRSVGERYSLFDMVTGFERVKQACHDQPPSLAMDHPEYKLFDALFERDQQVFIRRKMLSALEAFKQTHKLR